MAAKLVVALLVVAIAAVVEAGKKETDSRINEEGCTNNYKVDYIKLAIQWGPGYCLSSKKPCRHNVAPEFSIHGLWPQRNSGSGVHFCCARDKFSKNQLNHLTGLLKTDWPSLAEMNAQNPANFWEYQYMKHGRCASKIRGLDTAYNYFSFALKLFSKVDPKVALERKGITPSHTKTYSGHQIQGVLSGAFGNRVSLDCAPSKKNPSEMVLKHVDICIDTDLERIGCPYTKQACLGNLKYPPTVY